MKGLTMRMSAARQGYLRWIGLVRNPSRHTVLAYSSDLKLFEGHVGAAFPVAELTAAVLLGFVEAQRADGLSVSTVRRRACALRGLCAWLVQEGRVAADPWEEVRLQLRRTRTLPRAVPHHDLRRILAHLVGAAGVSRRGSGEVGIGSPTHATTLLGVALMVATGVRVGEVVAMKVADLDLARGQVRVHGKGARDRQVYLSNEWLTQLVSSYLTVRDHLRVDHQELLFGRSGAPLTTAAMRDRVVSAARRADVTRRVTPHMLRHTAATELIEAGVDIRYVQRLLGHASLSTTEIYTHVADHSLRRVLVQADVIGRALGVG